MREEVGRHVDLGLPGLQAAQYFRQLEGGVVAHPRRGRVGGLAAQGDVRLQPALLPGVDGVHQAIRRRDRAAAALVDGVVGQDGLGRVLRQPAEAVCAARLLVGAGRQDQVAAQCHASPAEEDERHHLGGDHVFHVGRAATPHPAVGHRAGEGRIAPFGRVFDRDDIGVAHQQQTWAAAGSCQPGDQVAAVFRRAEDLRLDALGRQPALEVLAQRQLIACRHDAGVDRLEADQVGEQRHDFVGAVVDQAEQGIWCRHHAVFSGDRMGTRHNG